MTRWTVSVKPTTDTLILGTSNLNRIARKPRRDMEIHSYPGGRFEHMANMLEKTPVQDGPRRVIIAMGINDSTNRVPLQKVEAMVQKTAALAKQKFPHSEVYLAGINHSDNLNETALHRTSELNSIIQKLRGVHSLSNIPPSTVQIDPKDRYGVHWTPDTAQKVLSHWVQNLN
jgi:hypothetical protein